MAGTKAPGIRQHHGKWQVRYYGPDGQRHAKSFARKTDALAFKGSVETDKQRGDWMDPRLARVTLEDFARDWLKTKGDVGARTFINIDGRLRNYILPTFGGRRVSAIKPVNVRKWVADMSKTRAPSTVRATYRTFSQIMRTAEIDGLTRRSPCNGIDLPAEGSGEEMHFLTPEQVATLAETIDGRYRALIFTAAYTGMRAGELAALKVSRVNLLKRRLDVVESLSEVRGALVTGPTKTRVRRSVTLPAFLADMLGEHIGGYPSDDGYVFTMREGGPLRQGNFYKRVFRPAVARAGLSEGLRFHDLRHSCAAILIDQGSNPKQVQARLGHASIRTTLDSYGHLFDSHDSELLRELDVIFWDSTA